MKKIICSGIANTRFILQNETLKRTFSRSLEIIGEASKNIPDDFRKDHDEIDWKGMTGLRDV